MSHDRAFLDACTDHTLALNRTGPELVQGNFSVWYQEKSAGTSGETARNEAPAGRDPPPGAGVPPDLPLVRPGGAEQVWQPKFRTASGPGLLGAQVRKADAEGKESGDPPTEGHPGKDRAAPGCGAGGQSEAVPLRHHSQRLLEGRDLVVLHGGRPANFPVRFTLEHGQRLCLSGGNGSGKTSLLRLVLGEEPEYIGSLWRASGLTISLCSPEGGPALRLPSCPGGRSGAWTAPNFSVLREAGFFPAHAGAGYDGVQRGPAEEAPAGRKPVPERTPSMWDEPLNYIDLFSRIQLEELILEYQPTMLLVEHDRTFCRRVGTDFLCWMLSEGLERTP